jgi:hypothetical protein
MAEDNAAAPPAPDAQARARARPLKPLPTERITFKRQLELIRAYGVAYRNTGKPVANVEVAKIVEMQESTTSIANAFFTATGFLQRGPDGKFTPASEVQEFANAHGWNPDTASQKLRPLLVKSWFGEALLPRVSFNALDEGKAMEVLALASSAGPEYRNQIAMLLEYLDATGVIVRDGGMVRARDGVVDQVIVAVPGAEPTGPGPAASPQPRAARGAVATSFAKPMEGGVQFSINVQVDMKEIAGWAPERIAALFAGIAQVLSAKGSIEKEAAD